MPKSSRNNLESCTQKKKRKNLEPCYHIHSSRLTTLNVNANDNDEKST